MSYVFNLESNNDALAVLIQVFCTYDWWKYAFPHSRILSLRSTQDGHQNATLFVIDHLQYSI